MLLRYERKSASVGNSASLLINISVAKPSVLLIHNAEVQGEPMTWGVQYVVMTQDDLHAQSVLLPCDKPVVLLNLHDESMVHHTMISITSSSYLLPSLLISSP